MEMYVESMKEQYVSIRVLSRSEFAICAFDKFFLNGRYISNHIVCDSSLLTTYETKKKHKTLKKT